MPPINYRTAPEISPTGNQQPFTNLNVSAEDTGAITGAAIKQAGSALLETSDFFGQVAADEASTRYQEGVQEILNGKPGRKIQGPDGEMVDDTGYLGLKGADAMRARPEVEKQIDELARTTGGGLLSLKSKLAFDNYTRRYKAITDAQIGGHARTQSMVYTTRVNKASERMAIEQISAYPDNMDSVVEGMEQLTKARVRQAQIEGGGPELINEARTTARRDALIARLTSIGASDPSRALRLLEKDRAIAGSSYDNLYNSFRARADQQDGRAAADAILGGKLEAGHDTKSVIRQFESFEPKAYWDVNAWRVGYGSDTITGPDGKPQAVTKDTVTTREDAERDLNRRAALSQADVRRAIGTEAWDKLDDRTKASLTSIAYNYGGANFPQSVADAAKSGDKEAIAKAIEGLSGHNAGVNRRRRGMEAANVRGQDQAPMTQVDAVEQAMKDPSLADRPEAQAAAVARINRSYALRHSQQIKEKAQFDTRVKDSTSEALNTGSTVNPIPREDFIRQYGEVDGDTKYTDYVSDVQFGADYKGMQTMSDVEMNSMVDQRMPAPGEAGYAHKIANVERLRKAAVNLQKERREDPAGAVSRIPSVIQAYSQYNENNPESFKPVAAARLAAQEQMGIEPELRTPITRAEALKLTQPLKTMLPGDQKEVLTQIGQKFQRMFGDEAERAFAYALRAQKVDAETAQVASRLVKKLTNNQPLTSTDGADLDAAKEQDAARSAITGGAPRVDDFAAASRLRSRGSGLIQTYTGRGADAPGPDMGLEPSTWPKRVPSPRAIADLLNNQDTADEFDVKYGTGLSKEVIKQFGRGMKPGQPITEEDVRKMDFEARLRGQGAGLVEAYTGRR